MDRTSSTEERTNSYAGRIPDVIPIRGISSVDKPQFIDESRTGYTNYFPEELPMRTGPPPATGTSWKQRMRGFWIFSLSSYSLIHTPDGAARVRHLAMITVLVLRTAMSVLSVLSAVVKGNIAGIVIYTLLAILGLWFTATCLAIIGDATGDDHVNTTVVVGYFHLLHPWSREGDALHLVIVLPLADYFFR
jgi:hypothetical protein